MEHKVEEEKIPTERYILEDRQCPHEFYKVGAWIKCKLCTLEHFDPEHKFPIKLWNKNFKKK